MRRKNVLILIIYNGLIFLSFVLILEIASRLILHKPKENKCENCYLYEPHPNYGFFHKPNSTHVAVKSCASSFCYQTKYTYDQFGRRVVGNEKVISKHLLLLGCSYTFGEGLKDSETLSYQLQPLVSARIYNYAKRATGGSHVLSVIRNDHLRHELSSQTGLAVYVYLDFHQERESMSTARPWLWNLPTYKLTQENILQAYPSQTEADPIRYWFYKNYLNLKKHSALLTYFKRDFQMNGVVENEDLSIAIIQASKREYEKRFNGHFLLVIHPFSGPLSEKFYLKLNESKIDYIHVQLEAVEKMKVSVCACDLHPSGEFNALFARKLSLIINEKLRLLEIK